MYMGDVEMKHERRSEAIWIENKGYWQIKVQKDGERKGFTSSRPGRRGKHEAEAKADKWLESGTVSMRMDAAWKLFLDYQTKHNGTPSYDKHESLGRLYILPVVGKKKLADIKPSTWQKCIDAGAAAGLAKRSCENIRGSITAFLRFARKERWEYERLEEGDLQIPRSAPPEKPKRVLKRDEIQTLFTDPCIIYYRKPIPAHYIHAWRLYVVTGMRRGELCGLRVEDIGEKAITIRRNINSLKEVTTGKNDNARRTFAITNTARKILEDQRQMLEEKGIVSPWVFPDKYGERPDPNAVYDQWATYRKQHGIEASIHELRHTFISIQKSDMPLALLKSVVGHSDSMDTLGIYGHEVDGDQERAAQIIDTAFSDILN